MKYYFSSLIIYISTLYVSVSVSALEGDELKNTIIPQGSSVSVGGQGLSGQSFLDYVLAFARDSIFALMAVIAIGMFLFIGARLIMARGNQEEFKKAMLSFMYAAIGIFMVAFAWAMVRLVAGIDI